MRYTPLTRTAVGLAGLALACLLTACAGGGSAGPVDSAQNSSPDTTESDNTAASEQSAKGDGEYAFGAERDVMVTAIEGAFSSSNGEAWWEGDTLTLKVDGDADSIMAGFTECRVLAELLLDTDVSVVEFPNGSVQCAELLADL